LSSVPNDRREINLMRIKQRKTLPGKEFNPNPRTTQAIEDNESKPCIEEGCNRNRERWSKHCAHHCNRYRRLGHALAPSFLKIYLITDELGIARSIILQNRETPAIQAGLEFFRVAIENAAKGIGPLSKDALHFLARLHLGKVDPLDCLTVAGAVWVILYSNNGKVLDERNGAFNIANLVARLVAIGADENFKESIRRDLAEYFLDNLAILLVNIGHTSVEMAKRKMDIQSKMALPLSLPDHAPEKQGS
jgi:hypothetical protein